MKKILSFFLCLVMVMSFGVCGFAVNTQAVDSALEGTAKYIYETVKNPQVGSVYGEWAVLGLARSGAEIPPEYYQKYYENVEEYVKSKEGVLHKRKYTEYSRVVLALTAIGKDPQNVAGYNLLMPLGDFEKTVWQGVNGALWALVALDSGSYDIPLNPGANVQATREMYVNYILEKQKEDGGWAMSGDSADVDVTAMAVLALSDYQDNEKVREATDRALNAISEMQSENGGFSSGGTENSESVVQVIVALCAMGISLDDSRFVKNGNTTLDNLLSYYTEGNGFKHTLSEDGANQMATEQGFYGLAAINRAYSGKNSLYDMSDTKVISEEKDAVRIAETAYMVYINFLQLVLE